MKRLKTILKITAIFCLAVNISCEDYTRDFPVPPASVVAKFNYVSSNEFSVPDTIQFINESIIPERAVSAAYRWDFGDGTISDEENPKHIFTEAGLFQTTLTVLTPVDTVQQAMDFRFIKTARFKEDFENSTLIPEGWVLVNVDGNTPDNPNYATMKDSAWIVTYSGTFGGNVALGISFYNPEAAADDWMILPKVSIGEKTILTWDAMSFTTSGNYPDSYQVYVSTTTQDVKGCKANGIVYRVNDEEAGTDVTNPGLGIQSHSVDLSKRFANKDVYVGFRLMTPFPGGDRLGIDNILIIDE
jgi:PKD repeat protein